MPSALANQSNSMTFKRNPVTGKLERTRIPDSRPPIKQKPAFKPKPKPKPEPKRGIISGMNSPNLMKGEKHGLLKLKSGSYSRANFMGPGTRLDVRIPRGDKGLTPVDKISKAHDLRYSLAKTEQDTKNADTKMIADVKKVSQAGADSSFNTAQANLIKLKQITGIPTSWITTFGNTPSNLRTVFQKELTRLKKEGF